MNETDPPASRSHATLWSVVVLVVLALYLLLPGAYMAVIVRGGWEPSRNVAEALESAFAPILWAAQRSELFDDLYSTYLGACTGLGPSEFRRYRSHLSPSRP